MAHVTAVTNQTDFRGREDSGNEATPTWFATANTNWSQDVDADFRCRFVFAETAGADVTVTPDLEFNLNGGGWIVVGVTTAVQWGAFTGAADGDVTTQQVGAGTFVAGELDSDGTFSNVVLNNSECEMEYCLSIDSAQVADADTIQLRVADNGTAFDTYSNTPTITVVEVASITATWDQDRQQGFTTDADWMTTSSLAALNVSFTVDLDTDFVVWIGIEETAGSTSGETPTFKAQYRRKPSGGAYGAWTDVNLSGTTLAVKSAVNATLSNQLTLTQRITSGTFRDGEGIDKDSVAPWSTKVMAATQGNDWYEFAFSTFFDSAGTDHTPAAGDEYQFRAAIDPAGGTAWQDLDTFTNTISVTVGGAASPQTITGSHFADPDSFGSGTLLAGAVSITGANYTDPDSFGAGTLTPGAMSIAGATYADPDTFGSGTLFAGPVAITGAVYVDPDSFGSGTLTQSGGVQTIIGSHFADPDSFGSGAILAGAVSITGANYTDPDSFGSGTLQPGAVSIAGVTYVDLDGFGGGTLTAGPVAITGAVYVDADSFGAGTLTQSGGVQTIIGSHFADPDSFGSGTILAGAVSVAGATYADPDIFGSGALFAGPVAITGVVYVDADSFGAGTLTQSGGVQTIIGSHFADPDSFGSGTILAGAVSITGTAYADPDIFGSGTLFAGPVAITGAVYVDLDSFGAGTLWQAGGVQAIIGEIYADPDTFGFGTLSIGSARIVITPVARAEHVSCSRPATITPTRHTG